VFRLSLERRSDILLHWLLYLSARPSIGHALKLQNRLNQAPRGSDFQLEDTTLSAISLFCHSFCMYLSI